MKQLTMMLERRYFKDDEEWKFVLATLGIEENDVKADTVYFEVVKETVRS